MDSKYQFTKTAPQGVWKLSGYNVEEFPVLKNDLLLRAAHGDKVSEVPVWIMRQAGRYLPEFRAVRSKHEFFDICSNPVLSAEITLQPIRRFNLDAAIIFSDILVIPQVLGMTVEMIPGKGPSFPSPLKTPEDLAALNKSPDLITALAPVYQAITLTRHSLAGHCPLIGFTGAPWTLMSYMIEGGGSSTMSKSKAWLYKFPEASHSLLQLLAATVTDHLVLQARHGAQMLQVFESHAGCLGADLFRDFALPYLRMISRHVKEKLSQYQMKTPPMVKNLQHSLWTPLTPCRSSVVSFSRVLKYLQVIFAKDGHFALTELGESGYEIVGLDWTIKPQTARAKCPGSTLQGNLDPCALYSPKEKLVKLAEKMLENFSPLDKYIANLGHGIYPDMDPEHTKTFIDAVHNISAQMNHAQPRERTPFTGQLDLAGLS